MTPSLMTERPRTLVASEPIHDTTRRQFITGVGAAGLAAVFLAACGSDEDDGPEAAETREFRDATGTIVIVPARPQRVVAVGPPQWAGAQVLSLGVPVVGMSNWDGTNWPDYIARYFATDGIEGLGWAEETDLEAVARLQPDLIVAPARGGQIEPTVGVGADALRAIAPLAAVDPCQPIDAVMGDYAALLGVAASTLEQQRAEYEATFEEIRRLLGDRWGDVTVSSCWAGTDTVEAWGRTDLPMNDIMNRLGVQWATPTLEAEREGGYLSYSLERLVEFDCDLMLYGNTYSELAGHPLFDGLAVVRAGQLIPFPDFTYDGTHYANYRACAAHLLEALRAIGEIRTDIV